MAEYSIDVNEANFQSEVVEASREMPVLVDFWAPWCSPCKALKPVLEKLAGEFAGKFRLAKLNTEDNPTLAQRLGVRSIPDVRVYRDGQVVDGFTGAMPEGLVRKFIEGLVPTPSEEMRLSAWAMRMSGKPAVARKQLERALELDPQNDRARFDLAELLLDQGEPARAVEVLQAVTPGGQLEESHKALTARAAILQQGASVDEAALRHRVESNPADLDAWLQLAKARAARADYGPALAAAMEVVQRDRKYQDEEARKLMVSIFGLAQDQELVSRYRKMLASALN